MFGILKKKISGFANKIFGKSTSKISEEESISQNKDLIKEDTNKSLENNILTKNIDKDTFESKEEILESKPKLIKSIISQDLEEKPLEEEVLLNNYSKTKNNLYVFKEEKPDFSNLNKDLEPKVVVEDKKEIDSVDENIVTKEEYVSEKDMSKNKSEEYNSLDLDKKEKIKKNVLTSLKGIFSNKIRVSESEISSFLEEFEFSLLEADVSLDSSNAIVNDLKKSLTTISFNKNNLLNDIKNQIKISLNNQLDIDCDINNYIEKTKKENEPFVILFIGPNGVGKTTTIAKFAKKYKDQNKSVILSSSDTFRAGSIQQLEKHASNLDVRIVKQDYGSDPAAVAYDALSAAKSSKADFVLIDTAGRQETNHNLMQELEKINRVVKPNITIYVAESQAGQSVIDQIKKFDEVIGVDGVVLTKIDTDPKGGVAISILNELKKPIFFIGTGQEYDDLITFSAKYIIERIVE